MEELEKLSKELKGTATLQVEQHYELTSTRELLSLAAYVSKDGLVGHHVKRGPLDLQTLYAPVQGNTRAKKGQWVGRRLGVGGYGGLLIQHWKCKRGKYLIKKKHIIDSAWKHITRPKHWEMGSVIQNALMSSAEEWREWKTVKEMK